MSWLNEDDIELNALDEFHSLGWKINFGPDIAPGTENEQRSSFDQTNLQKHLHQALGSINPKASEEQIKEAIRALGKSESQNLMTENLRVHKLIIEGCTVYFRDAEGETRGEKIQYIDFDNLEQNHFTVVNQFSLKKSIFSRRLDIVAFVNGIPLAIFELKSPTKRWATLKGAYRQLGTYQREFQEMFNACATQVIADGLTAAAGSVGSPLQHFAPWKSIDSEKIAPRDLTGLQVLIRGLFEQRRFLDFVRNFQSFSREEGKLVRRSAKYHQFWAVNSALESAVNASTSGNGRGGIVWHTQGSGKSLEMLYLAGKLMRDKRLSNPTVVLLTDRNDLDDQLHDEVFAPDELLPETPVQAESALHLKTLLKRMGGGIIFTTIQKFRPNEYETRHELLSERRNIVVITDEAHRSQYDFIDGFARHLRDALPNATYIGFTGTPLNDEDRSTREVFGDYVSVYDLTRAVSDGATVKIYYQSRLAKVVLPIKARRELDLGVEEILETEESIHTREKAKSRWARQVAVVGASERLKQVTDDLLEHWRIRSNTLVGKAMIVCMSREIAVDLYDEIIKRKPEWHSSDPAKGKIKVVITGAANDPEKLVRHTYSRDTLKMLKKRAKDPSDSLEIVIVRDMWLTGFDAPVMNTMYVDKPMKGHTLMQAIARVNRTFKDKKGGLIVDYIGLATNLREAIATYTQEDQDKVGIDTEPFAKIAIEKHDVVVGILSASHWSSDPRTLREKRIEILQRLTLFILSDLERKRRFLSNCMQLLSAFAIAGTREEVRPIINDVNLFAAVYSQVSKTDRTTDEFDDRDEVLDTALRQLVSDAVAGEGIVDIFASLGLPNPELNILSTEFLEKIRKSDKTNLEFELMKKVLKDKLKGIREKSVVDARLFSEKLEASIRALENRQISTAQAIQQLIDLAEDINQRAKRGDELGLTNDEIAFYDAITQNGSAVLELGDEILRKLTHELVEAVKANSKLDWTRKESVRAAMRTKVKQLLRKYKYPPDRQESAVSLVIEQAELFARDLAYLRLHP